jgi:hypothetical protein
VLLVTTGRARFTWGSGDLREIGEVRQRYIATLLEADNENFEPLVEFLRRE